MSECPHSGTVAGPCQNNNVSILKFLAVRAVTFAKNSALTNKSIKREEIVGFSCIALPVLYSYIPVYIFVVSEMDG